MFIIGLLCGIIIVIVGIKLFLIEEEEYGFMALFLIIGGILTAFGNLLKIFIN